MKNFGLFIFILFLLAAFLRIDFFFTLVYFFVGIYIVSRFWSNRMMQQLVTRRELTNRAFLGDEVTVTLTVENQGWWPIPWLMVHDSYPLNLAVTPFFREVISLTGRGHHTFNYGLIARRRGYYRIGPLTVSAGDLLGIHRQQVGQIEPDVLIVYPKIKSMAELGLPTYSPQVVLPTAVPIFEDPSRIMGVREYMRGDNPRHIHWKATATTGQTMMKQFQPAIARDTAIFLNMTLSDYDRAEQISGIEMAITVAASLANHMIMIEKLPVGLNTFALDPLTEQERPFNLPPRKERGHLLQILELLARIQSVENTDFLGRVRQEALHLTWGATIIIITNQESEALLHTLLGLRQSGFNPSLVLVSNRRTRQFTPQFNFPVFEIWNEKDIELWSSM